MSRYDPIRARLAASGEDMETLSFEEIGDLVGGLPDSATRYAWWWANEDPQSTTRSQCKSWQAAGYEAEPNMSRRSVTFRRRTSS